MAANDGWSMFGDDGGTSTGFLDFGPGLSPGSGVTDINPGDTGFTDRPAFDSYVSAFRAPLGAYAQKAQAGDVNAAAAYQESMGLLQDATRRYGAARGTGVNDATATSAVRFATERGRQLSSKLLGSTGAYTDIYSTYLAEQAKIRGYRPETIIGEEDELDTRVRDSYRRYSTAWSSENSRRVADFTDADSKAPGNEHMVSLRLRMALQKYEGANGLYSTIDRGETLDEAARLLSRINGNSRLNARFGNDYDKIIGMAAKRVLQGDRTPNIIDNIDGDIAGIRSGMVSYTGDHTRDKAMGFTVRDAEGREFTTGLQPLVESVLIDQAIDDRINGVDRFSDRNSLVARFKDTLSRRYFAEGIAFDDATKEKVYGTMAERLADMATRDGHVNLGSLADTWLANPAKVTAVMPEVTPFNWDVLGAAGQQAVEKWIGGRPSTYQRGSNGSSLWDFVTGNTYKPEYFAEYNDLPTITKNVRNSFAAALKESGIAPETLRLHRGAIEGFAGQLANLIHYANTKGDPKVAGSGDVKGYAEGMRTMLAAISMSDNLAQLGFKDMPAFDFGSKTAKPAWYEPRDPGTRYRDRMSAFANSFSGLRSYLSNYVKAAGNPERMDDAEFVRYRVALSYLNGIDSYTKANDGSTVGKDAVDAKLLAAAEALGTPLGFSGAGGSYMSPTDLPAVRNAWGARYAGLVAKSRDVAEGDVPARMMLDRILSSGFSDRVNPVKDKRVRELAEGLVTKYASNLTGEVRDNERNRIMSAVTMAMQDLGSLRPATDAQGKKYMAFDPLSDMADDPMLSAMLEKRIAPVLMRSSQLSRDANARALKATQEKAAASGLGRAAVQQATENGTVPTWPGT